MHRRNFLHTLAVAAGSGLFCNAWRAFAAWNEKAFAAKSETGALAEFFGGRAIQPSDAVAIDVLDLIEDGAVVPVQVGTTLPQAQSITLLVEKNPNPLIAHFELGKRCRPTIATRIKVAEPSDLIAVVESEGKLYSARKFVKVMEGGCG